MALASKVINQAGAIREFEKPEVCEAIEVANVNKWTVSLSPMEWHEREARLKKEYGKNHIKCDFSGNKSIEHCGEPAPGEEQPKENSLKAATDAFILQANEIMRLKKKNAELLEAIDKMKEGNPALKESASQFNDALLDEQAKKIAELTKDKELMKKASLSQLDDFIEIYNLLTKESQKVKRLGKEIAKLNGIIHDKNAILSDVAEELRLTKIREKNLAELGLKYVGENEKLKKELADKVVDKIDAQALKSAESALAYKEKVIDKLTKENNDYKKCVEEFRNKIADMTIGKIDIQNIRLKEKDKEIKELNDKAKSVNEHRHKELAEKDEVIAEKDEVIADLNHELKAKHKKYVWYKGAYDAAQQILNTIADYAAKHPDKKFSDQMVGVDNAEEGGDNSGVIVLCGKDYIDALKKVKDVWQE